MIDASTVAEIVDLYKKHGWTLRRALLSSDARSSVGSVLSDIEQTDSDLDALWFSRRSQPDSEAWELRRLKALPFALVTVIPDDAPLEEREAALLQIEDDMRERTFA